MGIVKISQGNSKLGAIPSVSLPAVITCRKCDCHKKCYASRLERLRPSVKKAYMTNLEILRSDPETYWREVEAAIMMSRFFRFHVSGDIIDERYFKNIVSVAVRQRHCEILCFTKQYDFVNKFISESCGSLPENLHIIFSVWVSLDIVNPYLFPEAHVIYRDGSTTARSDAEVCGGNCTECAVTDRGCWALKSGEQVVFVEH